MDIEQRMLKMELPGRRKRPRRSFMDVEKRRTCRGLAEDARDGVRWRRMICCGDSYRKQLKEEDDYNIELFYFI